jgi:phage repressor protein C with HTH and peptisase S24 domain
MKVDFDLFIRRVSEATGIRNQSELAEALQMNRSAITQARRKGVVPEKWLLRLFKKFGINPHWLETGAGQTYLRLTEAARSPYRSIPKVKACLSAGGGSFEVGPEIQQHYSFCSKWITSKGDPNQMVLMDIFGNSMEPELKDGDTVLVDQSQKAIIAGAVYAVAVDDTIMVKRIEKHPNKWVLRSDNNDYAPIFIDKTEAPIIRVIGKVIWSCREFR